VDKKARSNLRKVVGQARQLLEEDVRTQLKRLGIEEGGKTIPAGRLSHLSREDKELRDKVLVAVRKEQVKNIKLKEAYDRYVRHVGFTYLNRLAALRAMEVRDLIEETVIRRDQYAGMSRREYELSEREGLSDRAEIAKKSLFEAFNEVSREIKVLFDVTDEYSLLFPSPRTLDKLLDLLGKEVPYEDWCEDDVIGWIYQYYNSEARAEFKKNRRKPRPDDIPVINQFYTPRWLVKALVDNTLGRLWLEMKGRTPKPGEAKAPSGEKLRNPQSETVDEYCSYLIPSRQNPPFREQKSVREIKVLDPACGSGHFLIYAFDVLYRMYLEAEPETPREEIPRLILENNLFGIDIDLRSVQLAALGLFLKAKEYNPDTKIGKMNLVCADVRIIDGNLQRTFISRLEHDIDLQRIFRKLFEELEFTYDVGGLLKVRAPFERLLEERKKGVQARFQLKITGQSYLSTKGSLEGQSELSIKEEKQGVFVKPAITLEEMLDALVEFEREGMERKDMGTMLFAGEAEKSVGLLSILSQRYDVVVMNPPYGDMPKSTSDYAKEHYSRTHYDYYAAFIEQAVDLCEKNGFIGMLIGRTFMFLKSFEKIRTEILLNEARSEIVFDLNSTPGDRILDEATGRWAAAVARNLTVQNTDDDCLFIRLTLVECENPKIKALEQSISEWITTGNSSIIYPTKMSGLKKLPRMPYSYWVPETIAELFERYPPFDKDNVKSAKKSKIADLKKGLSTANDKRFTRYYWEVSSENIGKKRKWVPFAKGGGLFYSDICLHVNWQDDGNEIKEYTKSVVRNENFYFKSGMCWSLIVSSVLLNMRILPKGVIFSASADSAFPKNVNTIWSLLAFANSSLMAFFSTSLDPTLHSRSLGYISWIPIAPQILNDEELDKLAKEAYFLKREWDSGNEVSTQFIKPWILQVLNGVDSREKPITGHFLAEDFEWSKWPSCKEIRNIRGSKELPLAEIAKLCVKRETFMKKRIYHILALIDKKVYEIYGIEEKERVIIEKELHIIRKALKDKDQKQNDNLLSSKDHVMRLLSYYFKLTMERNSDGIVTLDGMLKKIREHLANDFGIDREQIVDSELANILGKDLKEWLLQDFFEFHTSLYSQSNRAPKPIFWHFTSAGFSPRRNTSGVFNFFIYYQKLSRDTIPKIRTRQEYLKGVLDGAKWKTQRLRRDLQNAKDSGDKRRERQLQEEYEKSLDELNELQNFDKKLAEVSNPRKEPTELNEESSWVQRKIAEVRDNGWNPIIDYGVRVNIEPLKEAGLLHRAADRVK